MKTIKCNKCYTELKVVEYDCGVFIEPCENCIKDINIDLIQDNAYLRGYNDRTDEIKNYLIEFNLI